MMRNRKHSAAKLGNFRLDCYLAGDPPQPEGYWLKLPRLVPAHFFDTPEAALTKWLASGWSYDGNCELNQDDVPEMLLSETGLIVDRYSKRVVTVVTYRWADLGESRLPVAVVLDVASGTTRIVRVESGIQGGN
jgi:hypothetical protein